MRRVNSPAFIMMLLWSVMTAFTAAGQNNCGMICLFDQAGPVFTTDIKVTQKVFFLSADSTKVKLVLEYKNQAGQKLGSTSLRLKDGVKGVNNIPVSDATWAGADQSGWFYRLDSLNSTMFSNGQTYATNPYRSGGKEVRLDFGVRNGSLTWYGNIACVPCGLYWVIDLRHSCSQVFLPPSLSISSTNPLCGNSNGNATATPTGGSAPYGYLWSNGATTQTTSNLAAGTYTVTVTDTNGATNSKSVVLTDQGGFTASVSTSAQALDCLTPSVTLTASSGNSYLWSNGSTSPSITVSQAGTFSVTVTNIAGCSAIASQQVSMADTLSISTSFENVKCFGGSDGSIDVVATGGSFPMSWSWSNGSNNQDLVNLSVGSYTLTATDANGCTVVSVFELTQPEALSIADSIVHEKCRIGTGNGEIRIKVQGGIQPYSYDWVNTSNFDDNVATRLTKGLYGVVVTDANGCTVAKDSLEIRCNDCLVAPNPAQQGSDVVRIDFDALNHSNGIATLQILNINGRTVKEQTVDVVDGRVRATISTDFGEGTFILIVLEPSLNINFTHKLIVKGK